MTTEDSLKATPDVLEDIIVDAYKRGYDWCVKNMGDPDASAYLGKAARDYADFTMNAEVKATLIVTSVNGIDAVKEENLRLREELRKIDEMTSEGFREGDFIDLLNFIAKTARAALGGEQK